MRLVFLIPLTLSLITGYVYQKSADEMAYLSGVMTAICLILSLILAPWQIQLVILIFVIFIVGRFWQSPESGVRSEEEKTQRDHSISNPSVTTAASITENQKIQKYRGASYESASSPVDLTAAIEGKIVGKYRGAPLRVSNLQRVAAVQPKPKLKYRGASVMNQEASMTQDSD